MKAERIWQSSIGEELQNCPEDLVRVARMSFFCGMLATYDTARVLRSEHCSDVAETKLRQLMADIRAVLQKENEQVDQQKGTHHEDV